MHSQNLHINTSLTSSPPPPPSPNYNSSQFIHYPSSSSSSSSSLLHSSKRRPNSHHPIYYHQNLQFPPPHSLLPNHHLVESVHDFIPHTTTPEPLVTTNHHHQKQNHSNPPPPINQNASPPPPPYINHPCSFTHHKTGKSSGSSDDGMSGSNSSSPTIQDRKSFIGFPSPRTLRTLLGSSSKSIQINVHNYFTRSTSPTSFTTSSATNLIYSLSSKSKHFLHQVRLPLMCLTWYASSALTNNAKKQILFQFNYPVSLTMAQFGVVVCLCLLANTRRWMRIQAPTWSIARTILPLSICQLGGHTLTSMAISIVPVAFVHTVKALGPLFTVLINHFVLRSKSSSSVWLSLLPLTFGVVLACTYGKHTMAFNWVGFFLSALSTIIFVLQNILSKHILNNHHQMTPSSKIQLSLNLSSYEPILPTHTPTTPTKKVSDRIKNVPIKNLDKINIMFYSSVLAWLAMIPMWLTSDIPTLLLSAQNINVDRKLVFLFILNGISHFTQSLLAFTILAQVTTVTYSIVSLLKRIVVIVAAIAWFGDSVSGMQAVGVTLTFMGLWLYQQAKRAGISTNTNSDSSEKHSD